MTKQVTSGRNASHPRGDSHATGARKPSTGGRRRAFGSFAQSCEGTVKDYRKPHDRKILVNLFNRFKQRHRIESHLTLMHFRHWVKRKAEQAGLDPSTADYLQGHQPKTDGGLSYGKVRDWETVIDEQRSKWPDGPLGFAFGPKVQVMDEDAPYLRLLADLKVGRLSELEFAMAVAKVKAKSGPAVLEP